MKNVLFICVMLMLGIGLHAQRSYQPFANDTTEGAETLYTTAGVSVDRNGFVTFDFTIDHDTAVVILQGSNNSWTTAYDIDTANHNVTTAVNYQLCDNPGKFLKYRLKKTTVADDTAYYTNKLFIYKTDR